MNYQDLEKVVKEKKPGTPRMITREKIIPTFPGMTEQVVRVETYQCQVGTAWEDKQGVKDARKAGVLPDHSDPNYKPRALWWEWLDRPYFVNHKADKNKIYLVAYPINEMNAKVTFYVDGVETDAADIENILCDRKKMYHSFSKKYSDYNNLDTTETRIPSFELVPIAEIVDFK